MTRNDLRGLRRALRTWQARLLRRYSGALVCILLGIHASLLAWMAVRLAPTVDEPHHLAGGIRIWKDGLFDVDGGNPSLVKALAAAPVVLAGVETDWKNLPDSLRAGTDLMEANGGRALWLVTLGRLSCLWFSVLGGWLCWRFSRRLFGRRGGLLSLTVWCFCPEILAHGPLVTGDMASAVLSLATINCFHQWCQRRTLFLALLAGLALGAALLSKYVCVLLVPLMIVLWLLDVRARRVRLDTLFHSDLPAALIVTIVALDVVNLGYGFAGTGARLDASATGRRLMDLLLEPDSESITRKWLSAVPVPLPSDYVWGVDEILRFHDVRPVTYFAGRFGPPRWYYYLAGYALKLPVALLVLLLIAFSRRLFRLRGGAFPGEAFLLLPALGFLVFVSVTSQAQFLRYALPVLPFVCVWLGHGGTRRLRGRPFLNAVQVVCVLLAAISSLAVVPHSLSFFNRPAGGPEHGHRWMIDSSHDWGQDLLYLKAWCDRHPERRPLRLAYFGKVDPRCVEIDYELPPLAPSDGGDTVSADFQPPPGWYAVSTGLLQGHRWIAVPDGTGGRISDSHSSFTWLQKYQPVDRAGKSILIYHIEPTGSGPAGGSEDTGHRTDGLAGEQGIAPAGR